MLDVPSQKKILDEQKARFYGLYLEALANIEGLRTNPDAVVGVAKRVNVAGQVEIVDSKAKNYISEWVQKRNIAKIVLKGLYLLKVDDVTLETMLNEGPIVGEDPVKREDKPGFVGDVKLK